MAYWKVTIEVEKIIEADSYDDAINKAEMMPPYSEAMNAYELTEYDLEKEHNKRLMGN